MSSLEVLWERMWAGGMANPVNVIEQISYLFLLRQLDWQAGDPEAERIGFDKYPELRWLRLGSLPDDQLLSVLEEELIDFLVEALGGEDMQDTLAEATFSMPTGGVVRDCMDAIDRLQLGSNDGEVVNRTDSVFEELLDQLPLSGADGQFKTPRHVIKAIIDLVEPRPGEKVCDPAAGTGGFLVEARRRLPNEPDDHFRGFDVDPAMVRLGLANMFLHGIRRPHMRHMDSLSPSFDLPPAEVVVSNPPFGVALDSDVQADLGIETGRSELLFLELCRNMLWHDGRAAVIVPEGVLFGRSAAHVECRRRWLKQKKVEAVISLPAGIFLPHTSVKTAILFARDPGTTRRVWFCEVASDGRTLDGRREKTSGPNDLEHMPEAVKARIAGREPEGAAARELEMWSATIDEIAEEGWGLAPSSYREPSDRPGEEPTVREIFERIEDLDTRIQAELKEVRSIIEPR